MTANMIFPVDVTIEWLSKGLTLEAGDIIATGTPEGVGMGRTPQEFLQNGDIVETEVEGIGVLRNRIVHL
jgi:2-keto-4-pentenoate hydratase/2-oxohepta-3-ene-1,7-dioic acid hydratase in catechol pathway